MPTDQIQTHLKSCSTCCGTGSDLYTNDDCCECCGTGFIPFATLSGKDLSVDEYIHLVQDELYRVIE